MCLTSTIGFGLATGYSGLLLLRHKTTLQSKSAKNSDDISSFDFSSRLGWEEFYRNQVADRAAFTSLEASSVDEDDDSVAELEWHSSIPLETVASYCIPTANATTDDCIEVLVIGCGTSRLPEAILRPTASWSASRNTVRLTLLDSSPTCLRLLEARYQHFIQAGQIRLVCGDAVSLSATLQNAQLSSPEQECEDNGSPTGDNHPFDVIVDKGLMDALLCSEGWDGPVDTLVEQVSLVLRNSSRSTTATWVLVSYALAPSTKDFLVLRGARVGLAWEFNCAGSNERVEISLARKSY
jgi:hypothetical protein